MKSFLLTFITSLLLTQVCAISNNIPAGIRNSTEQRRADDACADPALARTYFQAFSPSNTAHVLHLRWAFVHTDTHGADWQIQGDIYRAWDTQQPSTFPFYRLYNPTTKDYISVISTTGNPPVVGGFSGAAPAIIGYVYSTQICGSVPLYVVFQSAIGDHWYTTSSNERDDLVKNGWIDSGIAAYVLPPSSNF